MREFGIDIVVDDSDVGRFETRTARTLSRTEQRARSAGETIGDALGGAFRDASGRLRAANGRFLTEAERAALGVSDGAKRATSALDGLGGQADTTAALIRRVFTSLVLFGGVRELFRTVDEFANIQNRVRTVTDSVAELNGVSRELLEIANATRSSLGGTAESFVRVAQSSRELGVSQREVLEFTESLNQAVILSGASARTAQAGLIQLSQGLASGALRGDELNSVLEQIPVVADVIAKGLGVTRGELRKLGSEGRISAIEVIDAFKEAREELAERFGETVPTLGQAFQVLRNEFQFLTGEFAASSGLIGDLSNGILFLADNLDAVARFAVTAGGILATRFITAAVIRRAVLFGAVLRANPIFALASVLTTVASLLASFTDEIAVAEGQTASLRDVFVTLVRTVTDAFRSLIGGIRSAIGSALDAVTGLSGELSLTFKDVVVFAAAMIDSIVKLFRFGKDSVLAIWGGLPDALGDLFLRAVRGALEALEALVNGAIDGIRELVEVIEVVNPAAGALLRTIERFEQAGGFRARISLGSDLIGNPLEGSAERLRDDLKSAFDELTSGAAGGAQQFVERFFDNVESEAIRRRARQSAISDAAGPARRTAAGDEIQKQIKDLDRLERSLNPIIAAQRELADTEKLLNDLRRAGQITEAQAADLLAKQTFALRDQLDPLGAVTRGLEEEIRLRGLSADEARRETEVTRILNDLRKRGVEVTDEQTRSIRELLDASSRAGTQQAVANRVAELQEEIRLAGLSEDARRREVAVRNELNQLRSRGAQLTQSEISQITELASELDSLTNNELSGFEAKLVEIGRTFADQLTEQLANAFLGIETDFRSLVLDINKQLAKIAIQQAILGLAGGESSGLGRLLGFQTGGSFKVGGSGGADSQLVAFRASPNETVEVRTPAQDRRTQAPQGPAVTPQVNVNNIIDRSMFGAYLRSPAGQRDILNTIGDNPDALRRLSR